MSNYEKLNLIQQLADEGMTCSNTLKVFHLIGIEGYDEESIRSFKLWNEYMPIQDEDGYDEIRRNLHILWESIDRVPLGINCAFAIPFRQILAKKLFKRCGDGFVANEGCRFNFANRIEVGENVSWNAGVYVDAKGGVRMDDFCMLAEHVKIFTHSHSEENHLERTYKPVVIKEYAKVYTGATLLPGVTVNKGGIVATGSIVTKDVDEFTLVSGIPAKPMRERACKDVNRMKQYMMGNCEFQVVE